MWARIKQFGYWLTTLPDRPGLHKRREANRLYSQRGDFTSTSDTSEAVSTVEPSVIGSHQVADAVPDDIQ